MPRSPRIRICYSWCSIGHLRPRLNSLATSSCTAREAAWPARTLSSCTCAHVCCVACHGWRRPMSHEQQSLRAAPASLPRTSPVCGTVWCATSICEPRRSHQPGPLGSINRTGRSRAYAYDAWAITPHSATASPCTRRPGLAFLRSRWKCLAASDLRCAAVLSIVRDRHRRCC